MISKPIKKRFQPNESDVKRYKKMGFNESYTLWEKYFTQEIARLTLTEEAVHNLIWDILGTEEESEENYALNTMFENKIKILAKEILSLQKGKE